MENLTKCVPESALCSYTNRVCMQNRLEGYEYCIRHILEDKSAPYKQCNYVYPKNGKRCPNAAAKGEKKDGYCQEHQKKAAMMRLKLSRKYRAIENPETLLEELEYFVYNEENKGTIDSKLSEINAHDIASFGLPAISCTNQELFSDPESERDLPVVEQNWPNDGDSDAESVDSEQEDVLKHAGTYTAEEVALFTRDKLIRLQSLYIEQFKRLQYVLKEKRRKYLTTLKQEKETMGSIHGSQRTSNDSIRQYKRLKALTRYHKRHGEELIMRCREKERRLNATEGNSNKPTTNNYIRCIYNNNNNAERCSNRILPLSKYCAQHILFDPHQVLFRSCSAERSCNRPIIRAVDGTGCILHASLPPHFVLEPITNNTATDQLTIKTADDAPNHDVIDSHETANVQLASALLENKHDVVDNNSDSMQHIFSQSILEEVEVPSQRMS